MNNPADGRHPQRQRAAYTRDGAVCDAQAIRTRHQCAQRLLEPLGVVIPWADQLTFRTDQTRYRAIMPSICRSSRL